MQEFDFSILYALQNLHMPVLNETMIVITLLGNAGILWILLALLALFSKKHRQLGIRMAAAIIFTAVIACLIVKNLVQRDRPCWIDSSIVMLIRIPEDFSFPSGHTTVSFAAALVIFRYRKLWGWIALAIAALIAFSRMYLFVHFPTDVVAGLLIGLVGSLTADLLTCRLLPLLSARFPRLLGGEAMQKGPQEVSKSPRNNTV